MNNWERKINAENTILAADGRAIVVQIPTPHNILFDHDDGKFLVQYRQSTIDFLGHAEGYGIAIEAKSVKGDTLEIYGGKKTNGLKRHQRNFLAHYARKGISLVYLLHEPTGDRYVLPVDDRGWVAEVDPKSRKSWVVDPTSVCRVPDGSTWLDHLEILE